MIHRPSDPQMNNERGQSLIQLMVGIGIMSIMMLAFMSMQSSQSRETKALGEVLASLDAQKILTTSLADGSVCSYIFTLPANAGLTFNATNFAAISPTNPVTITLPTAQPLYASVTTSPVLVLGPIVAQQGQVPSAYSTTLKVNSIKLNITGAPAVMPIPGTYTFTGNWTVDFQPGTVRPIKPLSVSTTLTVNTAAPASPVTATITGCMGGGGIANHIVNNCKTYYPTSVTKGPCGIVGDVSCPAGTTLLTGGSYMGSNISLQNSSPAVIGTSTLPTGWHITYLVTSSGGQDCNSFNNTGVGNIDATHSSGTNPCFTIPGISTVCGGLTAVCCQ